MVEAMTTGTVETIAEVVQTCVDGLVECLAVAALMQNEWAENRLADLNLWISGTGALARGRASLDHRLAARPEVREVVLNSLRLLSTIIDECKEASSPDQAWQSSSEENHDESVEEPPVRSFSPWSDDSSSSSGSESANIRGEKSLPYTSPVEEAMYNVESIIDQLARLAVAIRRSGRRSRLQKADQLFKQEDHKELRDHLVTMFLHNLGLLKGSHDVTDSSKLSDVQMRLIDGNLRRRNRFLYAQKHSRGLVPVKMDSQVQIQMMQSTEISVKREANTTHGSISSQKEVDVRTVTTLRTGTSASEMSASFLFPTADQMMPSASSSIMSSTIIDLDYPRPPKIMNASHIFRCPCCCESLPVAMATRNKWRKHVSDDLSPYSCVIPGCDKPSILFGSKDTWRDHILRDHSSLTYWVCFACNDGRRFNSEPDFVEHTKLAHATSIPTDQIPVLIDLCKVTAPVEIHRCPLCNWPSEEEGEVEKSVLLDHIAKELHVFSLRSLPWADNNGQEMDQRIAWSSGKVYDWMIQNNIQSNPTQDPPRRDQRLYVSKYFEENDYFADSSGESGTSQAESEFSRAQELRKLKQVEGSSLGLSEEDGFDEHPTRHGTTRSEDSGSPDLDPAESSSDDLQNEISTQNVQANELIQVKKEELGNIYAEHSISNADLEFLPRHRLQERRGQSPPRPAFNASVPDEESKDSSSEPYKGLDQLPWAIPQLTYTSYDSTLGGELQPETELDHGLDNPSQEPEAEFKAGPVYESWADFYIPEEIRLASGSQSLGEDANVNYEIRSEDGDSSRVKAVPSDYSMEAQHHQDSQRRSHVSATSTELEIQPPILELNGMTLNFKEDDTSSICTEMGSIQLDEGDGSNPTPDPRSPDSDARKSPYSHATGDKSNRQILEDLQRIRDRKIDHLPYSHQNIQAWTAPQLNAVPPPGDGDKPVLQLGSQKPLADYEAQPVPISRMKWHSDLYEIKEQSRRLLSNFDRYCATGELPKDPTSPGGGVLDVDEVVTHLRQAVSRIKYNILSHSHGYEGAANTLVLILESIAARNQDPLMGNNWGRTSFHGEDEYQRNLYYILIGSEDMELKPGDDAFVLSALEILPPSALYPRVNELRNTLNKIEKNRAPKNYLLRLSALIRSIEEAGAAADKSQAEHGPLPEDGRPNKSEPHVQPQERVPRRRERDSAGSTKRPRRRPGVSFPDYDSFSSYMKEQAHRPERELALEERPEMFSTGSESDRDLSPTASSHDIQGYSSKEPYEHEQKHTAGHTSQPSEEEASLEDEGEEENRQHRETQKATLAKALEKANSAVLLDNAANFEGAMEAYTDACDLLQLVMIGSRGGDEEKAKLKEIRDTYMARIAELQRMDYALPDLDGDGLPDSADDGSRVDSQPGSPASTSQPNMNFDSLDLAQAIENTDERGHEEKRRAEEEQKSEIKRMGEPVLVRNYSMEDAKHQDILHQHDEQEYRARRGSSRGLFNQFNPEVGSEYRLEENKTGPEPSHRINVLHGIDDRESALRAVAEGWKKRRASTDRTRQHDLEKEKKERHWNVFNAFDENFFVATESDPTELEKSSTEDDFDQTLAERPAREMARGSPGDLDNLYGSDNKRKLIYQHDDTKPNQFHGQDFVPSEPLNQIPEESGPSSLPKTSKKPSRKDNEKGKNPTRDDHITSAQSGQTYEEPGASSSNQDSSNPYPDLPPLTASVEDWLSRSRPTDNVVSDRSPDQLHEAGIPGQRDLIPLGPADPLAWSQIEDSPHSPGQPSMQASKQSEKKHLKQFARTGKRLGRS